MKRANIIVLTKTDPADKETISLIDQKIKQYNPGAPVFTASHKSVALINASGESADVDTLKGRKIYAFSGIANGDYFRDILTAGELILSDLNHSGTTIFTGSVIWIK